jgi:GT2 family glycosyltransferase
MTTTPRPLVSAIVAVHNASPAQLNRLVGSLGAQDLQRYEAILVDDGSATPCALAGVDRRVRLIRRRLRTGPAAARNRGAMSARGTVLFFTDHDCWLDPPTLREAFSRCAPGVLSAGETVTTAHSRLGRAAALLGFPGGGSLGFTQVWRVGADGSTDSASACNLAVTREDFRALGGFDPSFPVAGGEDTVFARSAVAGGYRIRFSPAQRVFHEERGRLGDLLRWQLLRGRGSFHIHRCLGSIGGFVPLRLWSFGNSLRAAAPAELPLVSLLILSFLALHGVGYWGERLRWAAGRRRRGVRAPVHLPR